ncbi:MAG: outer membrane beta-barrel protein [Chromatiales bacterium]|nr:MAG: outer membrane beta-barrel protein [Chromatiales bacterium]
MKRIVFATMALALVAFGAQAQDQGGNEDAKWRVGGGAAFSDFEDDDGIIDDNQVGFALFGQYQFNKWVGIEGGYLNTGDFEGRIGTGSSQEKLDLSFRGFHIAGVVYAPLNQDDIDVYAKVGFFDFDTDLSSNGAIDSSGHQDGAMAGAGAVVNIADQWGIRAEFDWFDTENSDFWTAILGVEYQF